MADVSNWEIITSVGTMIGGLAAAVSAGFSWRSARASREVAEQTRVSAGHVLKPTLQLAITENGFAVVNESPFDALEVSVSVTREGKTQDLWSTPRLPGVGYQAEGPAQPGTLALGQMADRANAQIRVRYSDAQRLLEWEERFAIGWFEAADGWWVEKLSDGVI